MNFRSRGSSVHSRAINARLRQITDGPGRRGDLRTHLVFRADFERCLAGTGIHQTIPSTSHLVWENAKESFAELRMQRMSIGEHVNANGRTIRPGPKAHTEYRPQATLGKNIIRRLVVRGAIYDNFLGRHNPNRRKGERKNGDRDRADRACDTSSTQRSAIDSFRTRQA